MTSRMIFRIAIVLIISCQAGAYETPTHSEITNRAIERSVLVTDPDLMVSLGIAAGLDQVTFPSEVPVDENNPLPDKTFYMLRSPVRRIIRAGAVLEDRASNSLHHFYDPLHGGRGLVLGSSGIAVPAGIPSPDWMLETETNILSKVFRQDFSYSDTLGYFYKALISNQLAVRELNFGLMFRGIGHLVHHMQDMAQPQHVRNDQHCDASTAPVCRFTDNPSHFEKYTDEFRKTIVASLGPEDIPDYPLLRQYWANASRTGLADFTQSNFISQGTNFTLDSLGSLSGNQDYPLPVPRLEPLGITYDLLTVLQEALINPVAIDRIMKGLQCDMPQVCELDFIASNIVDYRQGGSNTISVNPRASTISLLDNELRARDLRSGITTTYNRLNFHAAYPFLISRAIAYSAGLINHFFRGQLSIERTGVDQEQNTIITVTNRSSPGAAFTNGKFELYYESVNDGRKALPQFRISAGGLPLAVGESLQLTITAPNDVDTELDQPYLLVFNAIEGKLGAEPGIAASHFSIAIPGKVLRLSQNANNCPERTYGVAIVFDHQPENDGQVILRGMQSGQAFDFSSVPAGAGMIRAGAMWRHMVYEYSGEYMYEVTYRYQDSTANPCTSPWLGPWIEGEAVEVLH